MRAIPCLSLAVTLSGCFLDHGRPGDDPPPPPPLLDADFADATPDDAALDAAPADAGACRFGSLTEMCSAPFFPDAGGSIRLSIDDCHCGGFLECDLTLRREATEGALGVLDARVRICDESDCRACTGPQEVSCELPPLPAGRYQVATRAGEFELFVGTPPSDPVYSSCQSVGPAGGLCESLGDPYAPDEICLTPGRPTTIRGGSDCAHDPGPCGLTTITSRVGTSLFVEPHERSCDESGPVWDCENWQCPAAPTEGEPMPVTTVGGVEVGVFDPALREEQCFVVPEP